MKPREEGWDNFNGSVTIIARCLRESKHRENPSCHFKGLEVVTVSSMAARTDPFSMSPRLCCA